MYNAFWRRECRRKHQFPEASMRCCLSQRTDVAAAATFWREYNEARTPQKSILQARGAPIVVWRPEARGSKKSTCCGALLRLPSVSLIYWFFYAVEGNSSIDYVRNNAPVLAVASGSLPHPLIVTIEAEQFQIFNPLSDVDACISHQWKYHI